MNDGSDISTIVECPNLLTTKFFVIQKLNKIKKFFKNAIISKLSEKIKKALNISVATYIVPLM